MERASSAAAMRALQGGARPRRGGHPGRRGARARRGRLDGRGGGPLPGPAPDRAARAAGDGAQRILQPRAGRGAAYRAPVAAGDRHRRGDARGHHLGSRSAACGAVPGATRSPGRRLHSGRCFTSTRSLGLPLCDRAASVTAEPRCSGDRPGLGLDVCGSPGVSPLSFLVARYAVLKHSGRRRLGCCMRRWPLPWRGLVLTPVNGLYLTPIMNGAAVGGEAADGRRTKPSGRRWPALRWPSSAAAPGCSSRRPSSVGAVRLPLRHLAVPVPAGRGRPGAAHRARRGEGYAATRSRYALLALTAWVAAPRLGLRGVALGFIPQARQYTCSRSCGSG